MFGSIRRALLVFSVVTVLAGAVVAVSATPALAYGKANWQVTFSGTGTFPGSGVGFGFWGWCDLAGGVLSGTNGDCEFAEYVHTPGGGGFTCEQSDDLTAWNVALSSLFNVNTFFITGTATIRPVGATVPCLLFFPGSASFTGVDSGIPAAAGHYNFGPLGVVGEFQMQVTQIG